MFCSHQRQGRLLSINIDVLSNFLLVDSSFILLVDFGKPLRGLLLETNNSVSVPSREHHVCFFQAFATSCWLLKAAITEPR